MTKQNSTLEDLQTEWKEMFQKTLPSAATSEEPCQPKWPVHIDHCFARIILDNVVGIDTPWTEKLKSPAYKNMTAEQLEDSIKMGQEILSGDADLVELHNRSLELRGKQKGSVPRGQRKRNMSDEVEVCKKDSKKHKSSPRHTKHEEQEESTATERSPHFPTSPRIEEIVNDENEDLKPWLKKIALSTITPFQKRVLTALCQVPRGQYTTYGTISNHLSSAPRAVGNALRNNPFAPQVPCHRVLATGGGLGGFMGSWGKKGEAGKNDNKKIMLLRSEGVKFDGHGRVVGRVWDNFK